MAESEAQAGNYDNMVKMVEDLSKDLEKLLEEIEKLTVQATWMAYDMVVMRTNPHLSNSMRRLEDAFLSCKEEMEKKWQEVLSEYKVFLFSSHRSFTDTVEDGFAFIILRTTYLYICGSILMRLHITYIFMLKTPGQVLESVFTPVHFVWLGSVLFPQLDTSFNQEVCET
nr:synaptonemal complex central element protein 3 isoform X3 [Columba livia]